MKDATKVQMAAMKVEDKTFHRYVIQLLVTLWTEGEGFSGKRPFGNSGWQYDVYAAMIRDGLVKGKLDEDGYVEEINHETADKLIVDFIKSLTLKVLC